MDSLQKQQLSAMALRDATRDQQFGIEIELQTDRSKLAHTVGRAIGGEVTELPFNKNLPKQQRKRTHSIKSPTGRKWGVDFDISVADVPSAATRSKDPTAAEIVSPILYHEDLPDLEKVIQAMQKQDFKVHDRCGIHVHIDGAPFSNYASGFDNPLNRLAANFFVNQDILYKALGLPSEFGESGHKKKLDGDVVEKMISARTPGERYNAWYDQDIEGKITNPDDYYNRTRKHGLNLHSYHRTGTIEFRMFNTPEDLCPKTIRAYVELCSALSAASLANAKMPPILRDKMSPQKSMGYFLNAIGLRGEAYAETREILTQNLSENAISRQALDAYMERYDYFEHGQDIELDSSKRPASPVRSSEMSN